MHMPAFRRAVSQGRVMQAQRKAVKAIGHVNYEPDFVRRKHARDLLMESPAGAEFVA